MTEFDKFRLYALRLFVFYRWLFAFVGIVAVILSTVFVGSSNNFNLPVLQLLIFFVSLIVVNFLPYFLLTAIAKKPSRFSITWSAYFTLIYDLLFVIVLVYLLGGPSLTSGFFFFWPILVAVVLFDFWLPIFTALTSSLIMFFLVFLEKEGFVTYFSNPVVMDWAGFDDKYNSVLNFSLLYILAGVILAYNYHLVKPVKIFKAHEVALPTEHTENNEKKEEWVRHMNEKLETAIRQLHSKDLELKLAKQQLEKLEQAKSKFISVTTHQLRTPLSAIKWTFNMMLSGQLGQISSDQETFLSKGYESTQRMIGIVNNLLNLDHIGTDQTDLTTAMVQLPELVEKVAFEFENQLESKKISLIIKKPDRQLPEVEIDPSKIRMVVENLLDNAIKYTPTDGQVTIKIKDDRINSVHPSLEVAVEDSGMGIPEEEQKKIFHKFFRASNAVAAEPDGTGIGLFIAKDIIERHNGTMWFESAPDRGTIFHFTLPLRHESKSVSKPQDQSIE